MRILLLQLSKTVISLNSYINCPPSVLDLYQVVRDYRYSCHLHQSYNKCSHNTIVIESMRFFPLDRAVVLGVCKERWSGRAKKCRITAQ